jgi:hypothetical protein
MQRCEAEQTGFLDFSGKKIARKNRGFPLRRMHCNKLALPARLLAGAFAAQISLPPSRTCGSAACIPTSSEKKKPPRTSTALKAVSFFLRAVDVRGGFFFKFFFPFLHTYRRSKPDSEFRVRSSAWQLPGHSKPDFSTAVQSGTGLGFSGTGLPPPRVRHRYNRPDTPPQSVTGLSARTVRTVR